MVFAVQNRPEYQQVRGPDVGKIDSVDPRSVMMAGESARASSGPSLGGMLAAGIAGGVGGLMDKAGAEVKRDQALADEMRRREWAKEDAVWNAKNEYDLEIKKAAAINAMKLTNDEFMREGRIDEYGRKKAIDEQFGFGAPDNVFGVKLKNIKAISGDMLKSYQENRSFISDTAKKYGLPEDVLAGLIARESRFDTGAVGDNGHSFGMGQFNVKGALADFGLTKEQILGMSAQQQIDLTGKFLGMKLKQAGGDISKALLLYNGGGDPDYLKHVGTWTARVQKWNSENPSKPTMNAEDMVALEGPENAGPYSEINDRIGGLNFSVDTKKYPLENAPEWLSNNKYGQGLMADARIPNPNSKEPTGSLVAEREPENVAQGDGGGTTPKVAKSENTKSAAAIWVENAKKQFNEASPRRQKELINPFGSKKIDGKQMTFEQFALQGYAAIKKAHPRASDVEIRAQIEKVWKSA